MRWNPRYTVLVALLTTAALPAVAGAQTAQEDAAAAGPALVVEESEVDFGTVVRGNDRTHDFVLRNEGSEPLEIERVESSCGCTVASFDRVVPPGGTGKVTAVLETLKLNGPGTTDLKVHSNDPENPVQGLQVHFDVVSRIAADPGYARWLTVQGEEQGTLGQTLWAVDGKPFEVLDVETPGSHITAEFRPATEAERREDVEGPQWRVELSLDSWAPVGAIEGPALVRLSHPEQKVAPIPLSGFVRPMIFIEPQKGEWGTVELDGVERVAFNVRNFSSDSISITEVEPGIEGVTANVETREPGRQYRVELVFDPDVVPEGPFDTSMRIWTDNEKMPAVSVPLRGTLVDVRNDGSATR